jgi:hypothetical protein
VHGHLMLHSQCPTSESMHPRTHQRSLRRLKVHHRCAIQAMCRNKGIVEEQVQRNNKGTRCVITVADTWEDSEREGGCAVEPWWGGGVWRAGHRDVQGSVGYNAPKRLQLAPWIAG